MKRILLCLAVLLCLTACAASGGQAAPPETVRIAAESAGEDAEASEPPEDGAEPEKTAEEPEMPKYLPETSPAHEQETPGGKTEAELREILAGMSREQKAGQLFFIFGSSDIEAQLTRWQPGGVLLFTKDYQDEAGAWLSREDFAAGLEAMQDTSRAHGGIPLFIGTDEEGGTVTRASRNPNLFPARSRSPQKLYAEGGLGAVVSDAAEKSFLLRSIGVNVNFTPVCDVSVNAGDWIYPRTLGRDAEETARCVSAVVSVMRDSQVGAVLKHFPGYGGTADTHTGPAADDRPLEAFQSSDFLPFSAGIQAGAPFVLVAHNLVRCIDAERPASLSPAVHTILRGELGFNGVILTDDLAMGALSAYGTDDLAVLALQAGNDMVVTSQHERQLPRVLEALETGELDESAIDASCLRILRAKAALGLL